MQIVIPTYFIISIVYLNLYMRPDGSPGRFLLTILTFICLVTIYTSNRDKLPPLAYANAVDIWMLCNLFFVFAAIIELVANSFIKKRRAKKIESVKEKQMRTRNSEIYIITPSESELHEHGNENGKLRNDNMSNFMYNNNGFNTSNDFLKSNEHLQSVNSNNNLLTLTGKEASLHSTIHSSIENVLNSHVQRYSISEPKLDTVVLKKHSVDLDHISRIFYPILYLLFNSIYWMILLNRWFDSSILNPDGTIHKHTVPISMDN